MISSTTDWLDSGLATLTLIAAQLRASTYHHLCDVASGRSSAYMCWRRTHGSRALCFLFAEIPLRRLTLGDDTFVLSHPTSRSTAMAGSLGRLTLCICLCFWRTQCQVLQAPADRLDTLLGPQHLPTVSQFWRGLHVSYQSHPGLRRG